MRNHSSEPSHQMCLWSAQPGQRPHVYMALRLRNSLCGWRCFAAIVTTGHYARHDLLAPPHVVHKPTFLRLSGAFLWCMLSSLCLLLLVWVILNAHNMVCMHNRRWLLLSFLPFLLFAATLWLRTDMPTGTTNSSTDRFPQIQSGLLCGRGVLLLMALVLALWVWCRVVCTWAEG